MNVTKSRGHYTGAKIQYLLAVAVIYSSDMHNQTQDIVSLEQQLASAVHKSPLAQTPPQIIAVSKKQPAERIDAALAAGHRHFGENRVQEAYEHWKNRKCSDTEITLHLIGPLQSNKVKEAVALFDIIHTVDREKIARAIQAECEAQDKNIPCFIQVNTGEESQKNGVTPSELPALLNVCKGIGLHIIGLMCIPPAGINPAPHFALLKKLADTHGLKELSMGMSGDYETAARLGATYVRIGTAFFGAREN